MRLQGALVLWCLFPLSSIADDVLLRASVEPADAWVGQRVTLQIDVLGADGWAQISRFGEIDLSGAYLTRTESQGTRLQESINGVSYTGQRYEVSIYPQLAGPIEVPAIPVEVTIKAWGAGAKHRVLQRQTAAVTITAEEPPGAEGLSGLVSTTRLSAVQDWMPVDAAFRVGDALQRTVTLQADDVSGMAFAPLQHADQPGVGIYPAEPELVDRSDRGALSGRRIEAVTYVFERAGKVQIPDIEITWWNVATEELETVNLPGRALEVAPGPVGDAAPLGLSASKSMNTRDLWLAGATLLAASVVMLRVGRPLMQRWRVWLRRRRESEAYYFKRAISSVRSKNARLALRDIMRWLDRLSDTDAPAQLQAFMRRYGDSRATAKVEQLLQAITADNQLTDPAALIDSVKKARERWYAVDRSASRRPYVLPKLNNG